MQKLRCDSIAKLKEALPGLRKSLADEGALWGVTLPRHLSAGDDSSGGRAGGRRRRR